MKFKKVIGILLSVVLIVSFSTAAYADVNLDNIINNSSGAEGRYRYTGHEWGWIVEVYVATTESGKLDTSKSLLDGSNAGYLGRVAFTSVAVTDSPGGQTFPALQRPVAIQLNGGGNKPQLSECANLSGAYDIGFPDPTVTGATDMKSMFTADKPALQATWTALGNGNKEVTRNKVGSLVSKSVANKVVAAGDTGIVDPSHPNCPVEYAFVLTPLEYLRIKPAVYSPLMWTDEFWMGANEGAVLNRAAKVVANQKLQEFYTNTAGSPLVGTPLWNAAESTLKLACTQGEFVGFFNISHRDLPNSAFLKKPQFNISTPNRNA